MAYAFNRHSKRRSLQHCCTQSAKERRAVSAGHRKEMQVLNETWGEYFQSLRERQMMIMLSFKQFQREEVQSARQRLQRRRESERSPSPPPRITELRRTYELMMKACDFKGLSYIKKEMRKEWGVQRRRREEEMQRWTKAEELRLTTSQAKKYTTLISRLEDYKHDKERIYLREQKRLKQKYKNVIAILEHEHAITHHL